jgi:hypothetical protein
MNNTIKYAFTLLILLSFLLYSCKKDCVIPVEPSPSACVSDTFPCVPLPPTSGVPWQISYDSLLFQCPYFLPNSNEEFYVIRDNPRVRNGLDLIKYNYVTKIQTLLASRVSCLEPLAVNEDWVVYNNFWDHKLYKVSSKGGNAIPVTQSNDWNDYPSFLADKKTLLVSDANNNQHTYLMDLQGNIGDTIRRDIHTYLACSKNNIALGWGRIDSTNTIGFYTCDLATGQRTLQYDTKDSQSYTASMCWHPKGKIFYFIGDKEGLSSFNVDTKEHKIIRPDNYCSTRYSQVNISSDGTKLICTIAVLKLVGNPIFKNMLQRQYITIMNIDGSCEKRVL